MPSPIHYGDTSIDPVGHSDIQPRGGFSRFAPRNSSPVQMIDTTDLTGGAVLAPVRSPMKLPPRATTPGPADTQPTCGNFYGSLSTFSADAGRAHLGNWRTHSPKSGIEWHLYHAKHIPGVGEHDVKHLATGVGDVTKHHAGGRLTKDTRWKEHTGGTPSPDAYTPSFSAQSVRTSHQIGSSKGGLMTVQDQKLRPTKKWTTPAPHDYQDGNKSNLSSKLGIFGKEEGGDFVSASIQAKNFLPGPGDTQFADSSTNQHIQHVPGGQFSFRPPAKRQPNTTPGPATYNNGVEPTGCPSSDTGRHPSYAVATSPVHVARTVFPGPGAYATIDEDTFTRSMGSPTSAMRSPPKFSMGGQNIPRYDDTAERLAKVNKRHAYVDPVPAFTDMTSSKGQLRAKNTRFGKSTRAPMHVTATPGPGTYVQEDSVGAQRSSERRTEARTAFSKTSRFDNETADSLRETRKANSSTA